MEMMWQSGREIRKTVILIQNIHVNNLEKRGCTTHKLGNTGTINFSRKRLQIFRKKKKGSVGRLKLKRKIGPGNRFMNYQ